MAPEGETPPRRSRKPKPEPFDPYDLEPLEESDPGPAAARPAPTSTFQPAPKRKPGSEPRARTRASGSNARSRGDRDEATLPGEAENAQGPGLLERVIFGKVGSGHKAQLCRQMAAYLGAGVGILKTLEQLRKQFAATALGPVLNRVTLSIRQGDSLTEALGREKKVFDPLFLSMIRAAEARGGVPETLRMLATQYEARLRLLRQARSALIYPVIVVVIALAVVFFLTLVVLPILLKGLEGRANDLPGPTQALMAFTSFVQASGWWLVPLVVVGVPVLLWRWYRTRSGKRWLDEIAMRLPVLGKLLHLIDTTRFARTLASLLDAGVDIGSSLDLTADVLHLSPLQSAVRRTKWAVEEGSEISLALADTRKFSPELIAVLESGEETGKITETLEKLADDTEERVEYMVKNLGSLIQPLIVIFLGGIVLFIALAFVMAYVNLLQSASRM